MDNQDRQVIEGLFARLGEVEQHAGPRDAGAEGFIKERITQQPGAPYFMAQTIVMQEYALQDAQWRIEELERQQAERPHLHFVQHLYRVPHIRAHAGNQRQRQEGRDNHKPD